MTNDLTNIKIQVITVSDRASKGIYEDESGSLLKQLLTEKGGICSEVILIPDKISKIQKAIIKSVKKHDLVITTGGTGINPKDKTPQATKEILEYEIPGISEILRIKSFEKVLTSILSRAVSGVINKTLIINIPGSKVAVKDAVEILSPVIKHAIDQLNSGDHS
ncbi:MAG: molybdenum cofactor biosynthesis protein B [Actinomycetes bacterium]